MTVTAEIVGIEIFAAILAGVGLWWWIPRFLAAFKRGPEDDD